MTLCRSVLSGRDWLHFTPQRIRKLFTHGTRRLQLDYLSFHPAQFHRDHARFSESGQYRFGFRLSFRCLNSRRTLSNTAHGLICNYSSRIAEASWKTKKIRALEEISPRSLRADEQSKLFCDHKASLIEILVNRVPSRCPLPVELLSLINLDVLLKKLRVMGLRSEMLLRVWSWKLNHYRLDCCSFSPSTINLTIPFFFFFVWFFSEAPERILRRSHPFIKIPHAPLLLIYLPFQ